MIQQPKHIYTMHTCRAPERQRFLFIVHLDHQCVPVYKHKHNQPDAEGENLSRHFAIQEELEAGEEFLELLQLLSFQLGALDVVLVLAL